jgi:hypothetical protein
MPLYTPIDETGILMRENGIAVLVMPGGGRWRLEVVKRIKPEMWGRRVRVIGTRDGFDLIAVKKLVAA